MKIQTVLLVGVLLVVGIYGGVSVFSEKKSDSTAKPGAQLASAAPAPSSVESDGKLPGARPGQVASAPKPAAENSKEALIRPLFEKALNALRDGNTEEGIAQINEILKLDPENSAALTELGAIYMEREPDKAAGFFERAVKSAPNNSFALSDLMEVYEMQGKSEKAKTFIAELARNNPESENVIRETGQFYLRRGNPQEGIQYLERATALAGETGAALSELASNYSRVGNSQKAIDTYRRSLSKAQQELEQMKADGKKVAHQERTIALTQLDLARTYLERGDYESAQQALGQARGVLPNDNAVDSLSKEIERRQHSG